MTKIADLEAQVEALQELLAAHGITLHKPTAEDARQRGDYIEWGSAEHAAFLGLVEITDAQEVEDCITFQSPTSGRTFRLEDEVTAFVNYPNPAQAALLVLRQKVSSLESGAPQVPANAPPMWRPADMM